MAPIVGLRRHVDNAHNSSLITQYSISTHYSVLAHLAGDVRHADLLQELAEPRPGVARHDGAHREAVRPELIISRYLVSTLSSVYTAVSAPRSSRTPESRRRRGRWPCRRGTSSSTGCRPVGGRFVDDIADS